MSKDKKTGYGTLSIVATPIGNLEDITLRALKTLKDADIIAAEDTRRTVKLLNHFDIKKRLMSYHEYSDSARERELTDMLKGGMNIALVSDAGTPLISDPGYKLIRKCIDENIPIESIPGPCAAITAVTLSGMDLSRYVFCGFLETKSSARKRELAKYLEYRLPIIIYESPNRVLKTLADIAEIWGENIGVCAARELTKIHEEIIRGSAQEVSERLSQKKDIKGEFVIIIDACKETEKISGEELETAIKAELARGKSKKEVSRILAERTGTSKNEIYRLAVRSENEK